MPNFCPISEILNPTSLDCVSCGRKREKGEGKGGGGRRERMEEERSENSGRMEGERREKKNLKNWGFSNSKSANADKTLNPNFSEPLAKISEAASYISCGRIGSPEFRDPANFLR
jgi:hypothetical protein